jgi:hypothetical protein
MAKRSSTWDSALLAVRPLIIAQGEVGYAYNLLQERFFEIFNLAMALERPLHFEKQIGFHPYSVALWHVSQSDRQQRQLALTALEKLPTNLDIKGGIERLQWARKHTDRLADYRNLIAHTPVTYWIRSPDADAMVKRLVFVPKIGSIGTKPINLDRLWAIKSVRFWRSLRNDFLNLGEYVDWVNRQIYWRAYEKEMGPVVGAHRAWPHRPKLPSLRRIDLIEQAVKNRSPTSPPARRKRRRTSRGRPPN